MHAGTAERAAPLYNPGVKRELRQTLREALAGIPAEEARRRGLRVCQLFLEQREYARAQILMIYLATGLDIDATPIALQAWADYKRVLAPKVSWEQRRILPIEISSLTSDVQSTGLGMREPLDGMPIPVSEIDLVLVPGLGFDPRGNRVGRGRGFYDRLLSHRDFRGISCGMALEAQVVEDVPHNESDRPVQMLVTEKQVRRFASAR